MSAFNLTANTSGHFVLYSFLKDIQDNKNGWSKTVQYVGYFVLPPKRANQTRWMFNDQASIHHRKILETYLQNHPGQLLEVFMEVGDKKRQRARWAQLEKAIESCREKQAILLISNLGSLPTNFAFTEHILNFIRKDPQGVDLPSGFQGDIICCDQIFVSRNNFVDIVEHVRTQRKNHGELIKAGLSRTTLKSGNPKAAELILRVNRPKIDSAIVFSLLLQPIIAEYRAAGFSQRKMVETLNASGFTAPEGGKWVLSQFQKVLERLKLNEAALLLQKEPSLDESNEKTLVRAREIQDIIHFNTCVIGLEPLLKNIPLEDITADFLEENLTRMQHLPLPKEYQDKTQLEDFASRIRGALEAPKSIKSMIPFLEKTNLAKEQRELLNQLSRISRLSNLLEFDRMLTL